MSIFSRIKDFFAPVVFVSHSELSDPTSNFPPIWFEGPHYRTLEVLSKFDPYECTRKQISFELGMRNSHTYERKLWLGGYVKRRVQPNIRGCTHFYTLTPKGRDALLSFHDKFKGKK